MRVRQLNHAAESHHEVTTPDNKISLFEDYAFIKDNEVKFGRLCRMRKKGRSRGHIEYAKPIAFNDKNASEISLLFQEYDEDLNRFCLNCSKLTEICATKVVSHFNLSVGEESGQLYANQEEVASIRNSFNEKEANKNSKRARSNILQRERQQMTSEGTERTVVLPPSNEDENVRRSKRTRTVISHISDFM